MYRPFLPALLALFAFVPVSNLSGEELIRHASAAKKAQFQHPDLETAWRTSQKSGKPMLLFFTMDGCAFCDKMVAETFSDRKVDEQIHRGYESVFIHRTDRQDLVERLAIRAYPTTFLVDPQGKVLDRMEGFLSPRELQEHLKATPLTAHSSASENDKK